MRFILIWSCLDIIILKDIFKILNEREFESLKERNSLAIFVVFTSDGTLDGYIVYLAKKIKELIRTLVITIKKNICLRLIFAFTKFICIYISARPITDRIKIFGKSQFKIINSFSIIIRKFYLRPEIPKCL